MAAELEPASHITAEIARREELGDVLDEIIYSQEGEPPGPSSRLRPREPGYLNDLLSECTKLQWNAQSSTISGFCHAGETFTLNKGQVELFGCCCLCCLPGEGRISFLHQQVPVLRFSYVNPSLCGRAGSCTVTMENQLHANMTGYSHPVGKLEYSIHQFIEKPVTITNLLTDEIFTAHFVPTRIADELHIKNSTGVIIAVCKVSCPKTYRGRRIYQNVEINFPNVELPITTKALMIAYGTGILMDQNHGQRLWDLIGLLLFAIAILLVMFVSALITPHKI